MKKAITENDILLLIKKGLTEVHLKDNEILTPSAIDRIKQARLKIIFDVDEKNYTQFFRKIVIGSDHTGVKIKKILVEYLKNKNYEVVDVGTYTEDSVDYPDIALNVAQRVASKEFDCGILIDATGIPSAITANKIPGIRAATCYNEFSAKSSREHNDANIISLGAKTLGEESIKSIIDVWLNSNFLGERHQRRLDKVKAIEEKFMKS